MNDDTNAARLAFFIRAFQALTGKDAFPWQKNAYQKLLDGDPPSQVNLPTGTGKTSFIAIWLVALAWQARQERISVPRRLVWVVNRRVVVDQATEEAESMTQRLSAPESVSDDSQRRILEELAGNLANISLLGKMGKPSIAVSTLRGQLADNGDWKLDPSRPAIIIGTVDMIGSRLLFSGYGDGKYKRPFHAGLLGHDAWVVLDEAHLTPAFAKLLHAIHQEQGRFPSIAPWRISLLSATQREAAEDDEILTLTEADRNDEIIGMRLRAKKSLHIHKLGEKDDELEKIAQLALVYREQRKRVLIFVRTPDSANILSARIGKESDPRTIKVLTGTQRGIERDALAQDPVFAGFRANPDRRQPAETHYLIATAAGEVGADIDADHLVCDLTPLDSLIQRFGRVNRLGLGEARVDLVVSAKVEKDEKEMARRTATLAYLESLPKDEHRGHGLSPAALVNPPLAAFSDTPPIVPLARHWLDMWSLTSIPETAWPDRPEVAPWLHGVIEDLPETWVVWRDDVAWLGQADLVSAEECAKVLDAYPILPHEQLREPTYKIREKLKKLAQQRDNAAHPAVLLRKDGDIAWRGALQDLVAEEAAGKIKLAFATVLLPISVGGLSDTGLLEPRSPSATDVADHGQRRRRFFVQGDDASWEAFHGIQKGEKPDHTAPGRSELTTAISKAEGLKPVAIVRLGETNEDKQTEERIGRCLLYFADAATIAESNTKSYIALHAQPLQAHLHMVGKVAQDLVKQLARMDESRSELRELADAFWTAGMGHDTGKGRQCWQRAIGNLDPNNPLAKSGHDRFNIRLNGGYRHEFGSLLDAAHAITEPHPHRDLILHLVACHHGNARPHFKEQGYDRESARNACQEAGLQTVRRFGDLQAHYGWWGLAYLEALLKAADALVSAGHIDGDAP